MRMIKWFVILVLIAGASAGVFWYHIRSQINQPLAITEPLFLSVKAGDTLFSIGTKLHDQGILASAKTLRWVDRLQGPKPILAADYSIQPGTTAAGLYDALTQGNSIAADKQVTIVEGLTLQQVADTLADAGVIASAEDFVKAASDDANTFAKDFADLVDKPAKASLEGYLFPDTYRFFPNSEPAVVIRKMLANLDQHFDDATIKRIHDSDRTLHQVITLASIVEREVQSADDMATVAGIFTNRLEVGMALQSDATVGYLTKSGRARSTDVDRDVDSPYNTYKYPGLPPGPISNPGWNAIKASIDPASTDYFYFLTDKYGKVYYAKDLAGHNVNRQYLDGVQ